MRAVCIKSCTIPMIRYNREKRAEVKSTRFVAQGEVVNFSPQELSLPHVKFFRVDKPEVSVADEEKIVLKRKQKDTDF